MPTDVLPWSQWLLFMLKPALWLDTKRLLGEDPDSAQAMGLTPRL